MKIYSNKMENRVIELLHKIPSTIEHKILDSWFDENNVFIRDWSEEEKTLRFELSKTDNGLFIALYAHYGFEGEMSRLPVEEIEVEDFKNYGMLLTEPKAKPLNRALEDLYNWLVKENLINEKSIEE
jgi:hypothetical protein